MDVHQDSVTAAILHGDSQVPQIERMPADRADRLRGSGPRRAQQRQRAAPAHGPGGPVVAIAIKAQNRLHRTFWKIVII
jgi:hypothetical protein